MTWNGHPILCGRQSGVVVLVRCVLNDGACCGRLHVIGHSAQHVDCIIDEVAHGLSLSPQGIARRRWVFASAWTTPQPKLGILFNGTCTFRATSELIIRVIVSFFAIGGAYAATLTLECNS